jgi:hypothetical protein
MCVSSNTYLVLWLVCVEAGIAQPLKVAVKVQKMGIGARHESS